MQEFGYFIMAGITFGLMKGYDDDGIIAFFAAICWPVVLPFVVGYEVVRYCSK